jgi:TolB-like protein
VEILAGEEILDSWKAIALYMRRDIRTLQRWETGRRLPVRRLPGGDKPGVYALKSELDEWLTSRALRNLDEDSQTPAVSAVAVLPFLDLSPGGGQQALADALVDELLTCLTQLPMLRVSSRTSSFMYRDKQIDIRRIGAQLNARDIVEGSLRLSDGRVRVIVQLIDAAEGYHLWSGSYDRVVSDLLSTPVELAGSIAGDLAALLQSKVEHSDAVQGTLVG